MSADGGSVKVAPTSETSCSSTNSTSVDANGGRRRKDYGRKDRKTVRILTVVAYILCVSMAAVLLSAYYVFIWSPIMTQSTEIPSRSASSAHLSTHYYQSQQYHHSKYKNHLFIPSFSSSSSDRHKLPDGLRNHPKKSGHQPYAYGNTRAYQQQQIPTPLSLLMTTQILTTVKDGLVKSDPTTTTSPTPPKFKIKMEPMI